MFRLACLLGVALPGAALLGSACGPTGLVAPSGRSEDPFTLRADHPDFGDEADVPADETGLDALPPVTIGDDGCFYLHGERTILAGVEEERSVLTEAQDDALILALREAHLRLVNVYLGDLQSDYFGLRPRRVGRQRHPARPVRAPAAASPAPRRVTRSPRSRRTWAGVRRREHVRRAPRWPRDAARCRALQGHPRGGDGEEGDAGHPCGGERGVERRRCGPGGVRRDGRRAGAVRTGSRGVRNRVA
jgi:hypothetical protein